MATDGTCPVMVVLSGLFNLVFSQLQVNVTEIGTISHTHSTSNIQFHPSQIQELTENDVTQVHFNFTYSGEAGQGPSLLRVQSHSVDIAKVVGRTHFDIVQTHGEHILHNRSVITVKGVFLGRTYLEFYTSNAKFVDDKSAHTPVFTYGTHTVDQSNMGSTQASEEGWTKVNQHYKVTVLRKKRAVDTIFMVMVILLVVCANIGMGCKIELDVVRETLRRPFAPVIGFCSQFVIMPTLAYGIARLLALTGGVGLGFFATGCAPGGSASNMYTYLLGGDVSLSVTMTLISTMSSLAMIPLWLFTLGQHFMPKDSNLNIPYQNILISLVGILIPVGIGIIIQRKRPTWARKIIKLLRPMLILFLIFMFTFGVWVNIYIFKLFTPALILAGCLLPYLGFFLGGVTAFILRQPFPRILTIAIETGIQNTGIPIILLRFSLPQPDGDLSLVSPVVAATFTPIPLLIAVAVVEIRKRCCKKDFKEVAKEDELDGGDARSEGELLAENGLVDAEDGQTKSYPLIANGDKHVVSDGNARDTEGSAKVVST